MDAPQDVQDVNPELESFREQWRAEVRARHPSAAEASQQRQPEASSSSSTEPSRATAPRTSRLTHFSAGKPRVAAAADTIDEDYVQARAFDDVEPPPTYQKDEKEKAEPVTALEHYERAVEKEAQGSLGDSLSLYRKAFRMDHRVDQKYKTKHFAAAWAKTQPSTKTSSTENESNKQGSEEEKKTLTTDELIASFSGLSIVPTPPYIKGMPQPPCPIASLPEEILIHILQDVAMLDVGDFVRLSRVCKRFAWLVGTEDSIWRYICLDSKFGFTGMHYEFQTGANWGPIPEARQLLSSLNKDISANELALRREEEAYATTIALLNTIYRSSWQRMFRQRPRIRFNGCYISTVNYIRPGQQVNSITWNSPVHIVTYYRYVRLFRDGTAITLCTVEEPGNVVHHVTKENLSLHKGGAMAHLPSSFMQHALRARWRLSSPADQEEGQEEQQQKDATAAVTTNLNIADSEGDLFVESDGGGNYLYRMELSMRTAGKAARNNKLSWRNFYSYNKSSEIWDECGLKNEKPFFFSRVKSYGFGELPPIGPREGLKK